MKYLLITISLVLFSSCEKREDHRVCAKAIELKVNEADSLQIVIDSLTSELKDCQTQAEIMADVLQDDADKEKLLNKEAK